MNFLCHSERRTCTEIIRYNTNPFMCDSLVFKRDSFLSLPLFSHLLHDFPIFILVSITYALISLSYVSIPFAVGIWPIQYPHWAHKRTGIMFSPHTSRAQLSLWYYFSRCFVACKRRKKEEGRSEEDEKKIKKYWKWDKKCLKELRLVACRWHFLRFLIGFNSIHICGCPTNDFLSCFE